MDIKVFIGSFLPVREDFHPRRNQARQKLATLISSKFRDLSSDVYHELKRRYPLLLTDPSAGAAVDDSDEEQAVTDDLESLMADLGNMVKPSDEPPASVSQVKRWWLSLSVEIGCEING